MTIFHILIAVFRVTVPLTPKIQRIFPSSLDRSITLILVINMVFTIPWGLIQPFISPYFFDLTEGDFFYYWKENKELITISKGEIINSHFNLVSDSSNIFYFYLISEILLKFVPASQRDKKIYRLIASIIKSREDGTDMTQLLLYFLVWILRIEGMMFNPRVCYNCFCRDLQMAWLKTDYRGILCEKCRTDEKLMMKNGELQYLKWTESNSPGHLDSWNNKIDEAKLIRIFLKKIELKSGSKVYDLLEKIQLRPDNLIVLKDNIPIPVDDILDEEQELSIQQVASGG